MPKYKRTGEIASPYSIVRELFLALDAAPFTQNKFANSIGMSPVTLSSHRSGATLPNIRHLTLMAKALGMELTLCASSSQSSSSSPSASSEPGDQLSFTLNSTKEPFSSEPGKSLPPSQ